MGSPEELPNGGCRIWRPKVGACEVNWPGEVTQGRRQAEVVTAGQGNRGESLVKYDASARAGALRTTARRGASEHFKCATASFTLSPRCSMLGIRNGRRSVSFVNNASNVQNAQREVSRLWLGEGEIFYSLLTFVGESAERLGSMLSESIVDRMVPLSARSWSLGAQPPHHHELGWPQAEVQRKLRELFIRGLRFSSSVSTLSSSPRIKSLF